MAQGPSGRIVIEVDPELKQKLYSALKKDGLRMRDWFLGQVVDFLENPKSSKIQLVVDNEEVTSGRGESRT